ncbi:MAG: hypothetical protein EOP83_30250 [Verrucomicrobiaceae bacterium]|nr:MAG: hypothetical protein EOP83_30250 [Verrucomicrobiaceae bacterium]
MAHTVATDYVAPHVFEIVYRRTSRSGEISHHRINIEAYKPEVAETIFHWRVDSPKEVFTQEIVSMAIATGESINGVPI